MRTKRIFAAIALVIGIIGTGTALSVGPANAASLCVSGTAAPNGPVTGGTVRQKSGYGNITIDVQGGCTSGSNAGAYGHNYAAPLYTRVNGVCTSTLNSSGTDFYITYSGSATLRTNVNDGACFKIRWENFNFVTWTWSGLLTY